MIKRILFVLALAVCVTGHAQNSVRLFLKSGETVSYSFSEKPVMTYSGSNLVVSTSKAEVIYSLRSISKMCFDDSPTAVDKTVMADVRFYISENFIVVEGERAETDVMVYDLKGIIVIKSVTDAEGRAELPVQSLSEGIYIVKTTSVSFKISKL